MIASPGGGADGAGGRRTARARADDRDHRAGEHGWPHRRGVGIVTLVGHYRFMEDMALSDCAVEIEGDDLNDVFATSATALAALMVDPVTVSPTLERDVALEAEAYDLLLYDWLAELIFRKDRDREIFPTAVVTVDAEKPTLTARLRGAAIDDERMALRNDPKAVTLHAFTLERTAGGWRARVVIDL